jgi:hypothetical protein
MSVKNIKKSEAMGNGMAPQNMLPKKEDPMNGNGMPSNDAPMPPMAPQGPAPIANEIPDHTHPEYDEMLVKIQEIQDMLAEMKMGGINSGVANSNVQPSDKTTPEVDKKMELTESFLRKIIKEEMSKDEIKGVPEMEQDKKKKSIDSVATDIPQTKQPVNGVAPSGGEFDSNDKLGEKPGDEASKMTDKPASDYKRVAVKKNALDKESKISQAKSLMEQAKKLLKEATETDPTEPMPGKIEKKPEEMDGEETNKSPNGGTESAGKMKSSEACAPGKPVEKSIEKLAEEESSDKMVEKLYNHLKEENAQETMKKQMGSRQSLIGVSANSEVKSEKLDNKIAVNNTIKEYLKKSGFKNELQMMSGV